VPLVIPARLDLKCGNSHTRFPRRDSFIPLFLGLTAQVVN
jgi:hypothetical protein